MNSYWHLSSVDDIVALHHYMNRKKVNGVILDVPSDVQSFISKLEAISNRYSNYRYILDLANLKVISDEVDPNVLPEIIHQSKGVVKNIDAFIVNTDADVGMDYASARSLFMHRVVPSVVPYSTMYGYDVVFKPSDALTFDYLMVRALGQSELLILADLSEVGERLDMVYHKVRTLGTLGRRLKYLLCRDTLPVAISGIRDSVLMGYSELDRFSDNVQKWEGTNASKRRVWSRSFNV